MRNVPAVGRSSFNRQKYCTDCAKAERAKKRRKYNRENYTKSKLK